MECRKTHMRIKHGLWQGDSLCKCLQQESPYSREYLTEDPEKVTCRLCSRMLRARGYGKEESMEKTETGSGANRGVKGLLSCVMAPMEGLTPMFVGYIREGELRRSLSAEAKEAFDTYLDEQNSRDEYEGDVLLIPLRIRISDLIQKLRTNCDRMSEAAAEDILRMIVRMQAMTSVKYVDIEH
jgi:hypothetical protein